MKKTISMFMAVVTLVTMVFAFPAPASATDYVYPISEPYVDTIVTTYGDPDGHELSFTVYNSGYYIIQTFGCFDAQWTQIQAGVNATLRDSTYEVIAHYDDRYDEGLFIYQYLDSQETYTLDLSFTGLVWSFRISFTNAADYFYGSPDSYYDIASLFVEWDGSQPVVYPLTDPDQDAVVFLVNYYADPSLPTRNYVVLASCCSCTQYRLVIPYGHDNEAYGGSQTKFDVSPSSDGAPLLNDVPYYLVIYHGIGSGGCPDHGAYDELQIMIVPADLQ